MLPGIASVQSRHQIALQIEALLSQITIIISDWANLHLVLKITDWQFMQINAPEEPGAPEGEEEAEEVAGAK